MALATLGCGEAAAPVPEARSSSSALVLTSKDVEHSKLALSDVGQQLIPQQLVVAGKIAFDDLKVTHVFSPLNGQVTKILARPGQAVEKGTPLAVIESQDLGVVLSDVSKARADLEAAQNELRREHQLATASAGTERDLETAQDNFGKAKAEMDRAQQKASLLSRGSVDRISQTYTLHSPISGEVIARMINPGAEVQGQYSGGAASELFTLGDVSTVWAVLEIPEQEVPRVIVGSTVSLTAFAYPDHPLSGTVDWVSSSLDPVNHTAHARISLPNADRSLKPEMFVSAVINTAPALALAVPRTALHHLGEQTMVYVVTRSTPEGGLEVERRPVKVNEDVPGSIVPVQRGLAAGERVVSSGDPFSES